MLKLDIDDRSYILEFRHVTKTGKRAQLHRGSVKAVTTCVIVCYGHLPHDNVLGPEIQFIAIDNALCSDSDNFWRREGRKRSLRKCLQHCGALKNVREQLWAAWLAKDPAPDRIYKASEEFAKMHETLGLDPFTHYGIVEDWISDLVVPVNPPVKSKPTPEQIAAFKNAGTETRIQRNLARGTT